MARGRASQCGLAMLALDASNELPLSQMRVAVAQSLALAVDPGFGLSVDLCSIGVRESRRMKLRL